MSQSRPPVFSALIRTAQGLRFVGRSGSGRSRRAIERIADSNLFDPEWYLRSYPDVAKSGTDPLRHYMTLGWREGRDPGPYFSTLAYLRAHADVRRSAGNPLLHFIEFGQHEGREISGHLPLPRGGNAVSFNFAEPNDCATFSRETPAVPAWSREYRLDRRHRYFVGEDDVGAGYAADSAECDTIQGQFTYLRMLSGYGPANALASESLIVASDERLVDAWYVTSCHLRSRWIGSHWPFVIRGYQCDPFADGRICLIGEALVTSASDFLDLHLLNSYFPVLITFAAPEGELRGSVMLPFPSLCRGGTHYAELLGVEAGQNSRGPMDAVNTGLQFAERLVRFIRGDLSPAVSGLEIDLSTATGSSPPFQRDFAVWLERVIRISSKGVGEPAGGADAGWLSHAVAVAPIARIRPEGAALQISADAVPTITALTAARLNPTSPRQARPMPLLVAAADASQPATLIEIPALMSKQNPEASIIPNWAIWPCCAADNCFSAESLGPGAIRFMSDALSDSDLFLPVPDLKADLAHRDSVTWLIRPEEWPTDLLSHAINAAALQNGGSADALALVGNAKPATINVARKVFDGEIRRFSNLSAAAESVKTPFVCFIGAGVIMHDPRSASLFATQLASEGIATVSCVLLSAEKRGGVLCSAIVDGGATLVASNQKNAQSVRDRAAKCLWRHTYPVLQPSSVLWMTRSSRLAAWTNSQPADTESPVLHLCSSVVTATYVGENPPAPLAPFIPTAEPEHVTAVQELVG